MKYVIILLMFFSNYSLSQTKQYYDTTPRPYIAPPIAERKALGKKLEERYYQNRELCNKIEIQIINDLRDLRIDSINKVYRDGLKRNLERIQGLKADGKYADYTILLTDILDDLNYNASYYKDEEEYEKNILEEKLKMQEEKLKKQQEEMQQLKKELELQKKSNKKSTIKKK